MGRERLLIHAYQPVNNVQHKGHLSAMNTRRSTGGNPPTT